MSSAPPHFAGRESIYRDDEDRTMHLEVIAQAMDRFDAEGFLRSGVTVRGQVSILFALGTNRLISLT